MSVMGGPATVVLALTAPASHFGLFSHFEGVIYPYAEVTHCSFPACSGQAIVELPEGFWSVGKSARPSFAAYCGSRRPPDLGRSPPPASPRCGRTVAWTGEQIREHGSGTGTPQLSGLRA